MGKECNITRRLAMKKLLLFLIIIFLPSISLASNINISHQKNIDLYSSEEDRQRSIDCNGKIGTVSKTDITENISWYYGHNTCRFKGRFYNTRVNSINSIKLGDYINNRKVISIRRFKNVSKDGGTAFTRGFVDSINYLHNLGGGAIWQTCRDGGKGRILVLTE